MEEEEEQQEEKEGEEEEEDALSGCSFCGALDASWRASAPPLA